VRLFANEQKKQEAVAQLEEERAKLGDKLRKAEQGLKFSIPRHIAHGLENVARIAQEGNVRGYFGPVYELIRLKDPKFTQAVEVRESVCVCVCVCVCV
jgi:chromosome segregation ATPase